MKLPTTIGTNGERGHLPRRRQSVVCRCSLRLVTLCLTASAVLGILIAEADNARGGHDGDARTAIFGEENLTDAFGIHRRAARLAPEARYNLLINHVLPGSDQRSIRVDIDFTPAGYSPAVSDTRGPTTLEQNDRDPVPAARRTIGGELVSPAIDLVDVSREGDRLQALRGLVSAREPRTTDGRKARFALLALIAMSEDDFETAGKMIGQLFELAANAPVKHSERGPEAVVMWAGQRHAETRDAARDLAFLVYEQARNKVGPRSERWHRQTYSLKHALQFAIDFPQDDFPGQPLENWLPVSRMTAETCGKGYPLARWELQAGRVHHVTCHDNDYLYYAIPLVGDFNVEADLTTFGYRDIHLGLGNVWAGPTYDLKACLRGSFRADHATLPIIPPLMSVGEQMRVRIAVRDAMRTSYVNGRQIFQAPHTGDPWLSIHSAWYANGSAGNVRITGDVRVPDVIDLLANAELPGWLAYFDESVGNDGDWRLDSTVQFARGRVSLSNELVARRGTDPVGTFRESLLRYHRPVAEDAVISYEFLYEPGRYDVHPALGRLAFLLGADGVKLHGITDGKFDRTGMDPANAVDDAAGRRGPETLPLRADAWNKMEVRLTGDTVRLALNGQAIHERVLDPSNTRMFGLFRYADQSETRVRNLKWFGAWPRALPVMTDAQLIDDSIERLLDGTPDLKDTFVHDFSDGMPGERFHVFGSGWEDHVEQLADGVRFVRPGGTYATYAVVPQITLDGDFDFTVGFRDLQTSVPNGNGNVHLLVELDDQASSRCRIYRKHEGRPGQSDKHQVQVAIFQDKDGKTDYAFPSSTGEESRAGRLRISRRSEALVFLYAEDDSEQFRLVHTQQIGETSTRESGVRLILETHGEGESSVVWKNVEIRAESIHGAGVQPRATITELNQQRDKLPARLQFDFRKENSLDEFLVWGSHGRYSWSQAGLRIDVPGFDEWKGAGLAPRVSVIGDFDISLELDVLQLQAATKNQESTVYLQTEFDDALKTALDVKYSSSSTGLREAEVQRKRLLPNGEVRFEVLAGRQADSVTRLRLARRDDVVYFLVQDGDKPEQIVAAEIVGRLPVPETYVRALVHTGGKGRETSVRFQKLEIRADSVTGPQVR